jgi:dTDP-4-dehydrorhamnose reductase
MLNLAEKHDELRIVADQFGAPTWSRTIAETTLKILPSFIESREQAVREIYHLTAQGDTTWHGFADAIFENANLEKKPFLSPITSSEYPTPARRPKNSRMSSDKLIEKFGPLPHWKDALLQCLTERSS